MPEENWWCAVKLVTIDGVFFFSVASLLEWEQEKRKIPGSWFSSAALVLCDLGMSNLHLEADIYQDYHKTLMLTCVGDLWVKRLLHCKVLWVSVRFSNTEIGLCHSDNCSGVSGTCVIQGEICPHLLNTSRAVGTGTIERERHSDHVLKWSWVPLQSALLLPFGLEAGIAAKP